MELDDDEDKIDNKVDSQVAAAEGATIMAGLLSNQITTVQSGEGEEKKEVPVNNFVKPIVAGVTPLFFGLAIAGNKVMSMEEAKEISNAEEAAKEGETAEVPKD